MNNVIIIVTAFVATLVIYGILVAIYLRGKVYLRSRRKRSLDDYRIGEIVPEHITFKTADGITAYGIFYRSGDGKRPLVIILHGYAFHMGAHHIMIDRILKEGWNVFSFDFRGCGESDYPRTTFGLKEYLDVIGAREYLKSRDDVDFDRIALWGGSMGAAVALMSLRYFPEIRSVVSDSAYYDITTVFGGHLQRKKIPHFLVHSIIFVCSILVKGNMWNASCAKSLKNIDNVPILFIHGDKDRDIPFNDSKRLYELYQGPKEFLTLEGEGHHEHEQNSVYLDFAFGFITKNFEKKS